MRLALDTNRYVDFCRGDRAVVERVREAERIYLPFVTLTGQAVILDSSRASFGLTPTITGASATPAYITTNGISPVFAFGPTPTNGLVAAAGRKRASYSTIRQRS